jgi:hypothetical protein
LVAAGSPDVQTAGDFFDFLAGIFRAFSSESLPHLMRGGDRFALGKTRQIKNLEPRFDSIETEKALAGKSLRGGAIGFAGGRFV